MLRCSPGDHPDPLLHYLTNKVQAHNGRPSLEMNLVSSLQLKGSTYQHPWKQKTSLWCQVFGKLNWYNNAKPDWWKQAQEGWREHLGNICTVYQDILVQEDERGWLASQNTNTKKESNMERCQIRMKWFTASASHLFWMCRHVRTQELNSECTGYILFLWPQAQE